MKKLNKLFAILVAMAMVLAMGVISAFAAVPADETKGEMAGPSGSYLVKYLELADTVTNPNVYFKFNFQPVSNTAGLATTPAIDSVYIRPDQTTTNTDKDGNSVYGTAAFSTFLPTYANAGVYTYNVTEEQNKVYAATTNEGQTTYSETTLPSEMNVNFDTQSYTIRIYVDANHTVQYVTATKTSEDGKEVITTQNPVYEDNNELKLKGLTFDNKATKSENIIPDKPNDLYGVLNVAKHVKLLSDATAAIGDRANDKFTFTLTLTKAYGASDTVPDAYVHPQTGEDYKYTGALQYGTNTIELKDGEVFYFPTLPAGTKWTVEENLSTSDNAKKEQYQAAYDVTTSDATTGLVKSGQAAAGANLPAESTYELVENTAGEKAVYTNTYDDKLDQPEGILISNLPYIALALVAIGGLVAYVVVRRRNVDEA